MRRTVRDRAQGFAKRRINLPVDELTVAIARNEAWKLMPKVKFKSTDKG